MNKKIIIMIKMKKGNKGEEENKSENENKKKEIKTEKIG